MGDFDLTMPGRRPRYSLGNYQLRLDPQIEAAILALQYRPPEQVLRNLFVRPNWAGLQQNQLNAALRQPLPPGRAPLVPRGNGPAIARTVEVGVLLNAFWAVPTVSNASNLVLNDAATRLRRGWNSMSTGNRVILISHGAVVLGSSLAAILSNQESRRFVLDLIDGRDIPIPKVNGLTVQINRRGGGATYRNIAGSGVTVGGSGGVDPQGQAQYDVRVMLDLQQMLAGVGR